MKIPPDVQLVEGWWKPWVYSKCLWQTDYTIAWFICNLHLFALCIGCRYLPDARFGRAWQGQVFCGPFFIEMFWYGKDDDA